MRTTTAALATLLATAAAAQAPPPSHPAAAVETKTAGKPADHPQTSDEFDATWLVAPENDHAGAPDTRPRSGIELSPLRLSRLSNDRKDVPVTLATTHYGDWTLACESRGADKACFASAFSDANGKDARLKIKFGPAAHDEPPEPTPDDKATGRKAAPETRKPTRPRTQPHYVMNLEAPAGLDSAPGLVIDAPGGRGILDSAPGCDAVACRASIEITAALAPILPMTPNPEATHDAIRVMASVNGQPILWRFTTNGLAEAFARVRAETDPPPEPAPLPVATARPKTTPVVAAAVTNPLALPKDDPPKTAPASAPAAAVALAQVPAAAATAVAVAAPEPTPAAPEKKPRLERRHPRTASHADDAARHATHKTSGRPRAAAGSSHFIPGT